MKLILKLPVLRYTLILAIAAFVFGVIYIAYAINQNLQIPRDGIVYEVKPGMNLIRVMNSLHDKGIVENPKSIVWYARITGQAHNIKVGEYYLHNEITGRELLHKLVEGDVIQYGLTIVEGWTFQQMLDEIKRHDAITHTLVDASYEEIMKRLGREGEHPEGRFFPETYHFHRGTTDVEILQRAYQAMQSLLEKEWQNRAVGLPYKDAYEALIMASIVEKETGLPSERQAIAGVFVRRLEKNMRLQTDPTIIYGLGKAFDGNLRRRDLRNSENPYNTYKKSGLTPTPIALPGEESIHAALHPDDSDALYFVSKGDGSHHFSSTLEEHNEAVIHYQLKGKRKPFSSFKPSDSRE